MKILKKVRVQIKNSRFYKLYLRKFRMIPLYLLDMIKYGRISGTYYHVMSDKKVIYVTNSKVACSSIIASLYNIDLLNNDYTFIHNYAAGKAVCSLDNKSTNVKDFYKFTYVRNPYMRLVSCYKNKCEDEKYFYGYLLGYLDKVSDFSTFIAKISKIPVKLMDLHFYPQYNLIYDKKGNCLVDYVGKFEDLPDDYNKKIADVFGFSYLSCYNQTDKKKNWMDYYTVETAELVYKTFRKDFSVFGYEDSYADLISYLVKKGRESKYEAKIF